MKHEGANLRKADYLVRPVDTAIARELVERFHYSRGAPNTHTVMHGLFRRGADVFDRQCLGVAWWLPPILNAAKATDADNPGGVLMLSRLVIAPEVPRGAATFLMSQSRKMRDVERWPTW